MNTSSPAAGSERVPQGPGNSGSPPAGRKMLGVFSLAMINLAVIYSVRGLPLMAEEGCTVLVFMALAALFFLLPVSLVTAELASAWPSHGPGGVYVWVREALGERWGFLAIWLQWSENVIWFPTVLSFIAATLAYVFCPALADNKVYTLVVILVIYWGGTLANLYGMKTSAWITILGVVSTLVTTALIIVMGLAWVLMGNPSQLTFSMDSLLPDFSNLHDLVFLAGALVIVSGIEVSAVHHEQVQNPKRAFSRATFISVLVSFTAIVLGSLSIALVVPQEELSLVSGLMEAFNRFFSAYHLKWLVPVTALLIVVGSIGEVAAWILGPSKGLLIAAKDGLIPPFMKRTRRDDVPMNILFLQAIIVTALVFVFLLMPTVSSAYWILTALTAQLYVLMYILLFLSAIVLRYKQPHTKRPYRIPGGNVGMWIFGLSGLFGSLFTLFIGFFPPSQLKTGSLFVYEGFLIMGLLIMCGAAFVIHAVRKPAWADSSDDAGEETAKGD